MKNHRRTLRQWSAGAVLALAACSRPSGSAGRDGGTTATPTATPTATLTSTATSTSTATPTATETPTPDGGSSCRVLFGPRELPIHSPAALSLHGDTLDAILDEDGHPRVTAVPAGPIPTGNVAAVAEPVAGGAPGGLSIPCAAAGDWIFCPNRVGEIHRTTRTGGQDHLVASARVGSRIAAAVIGAAHAVLAYIASRRTSEGWTSEAWIAVDDAAPVRLSEDGSGATSVTLAPRAASLIAVSVDARSALTALHARPVTYEGGLRLGEDAVIFVGGPGERRTAAAVALGPTGPGYGLLPIAKDVGHFGLALVRLDDPPRVDEPVSWSMYPNGIDPAPVAAVAGARTWVARVRPRVADPASDQVLEIGEVTVEAGFAARHVVAGTAHAPTDVALVVDAHGALWLAWLDPAGSWIERLACK